MAGDGERAGDVQKLLGLENCCEPLFSAPHLPAPPALPCRTRSHLLAALRILSWGNVSLIPECYLQEKHKVCFSFVLTPPTRFIMPWL